MKNINEINFDDYLFFFLTEETNPFEVKVYTLNGYENYPADRYDLINSQAGIIIGYKNDFEGFQNHMYESASGRKYIQLICYDFIKDILDEQQIGSFDFYAFFDSVYIPSDVQYETEAEKIYDSQGNLVNRCDVDKFGIKVFYPVTNSYNIIKIRTLINIAGLGHIAYFNTIDEGNLNPYSRTKNVSARTFTGIIKVLDEWATASQEPFNNSEDPAIKAKQMIEELAIPEELLSWVNENQIQMPVARYISGETDMATIHQENTQMPEVAKAFLKSNCLYKNIASMKMHHPSGSNIESSLVEKELNYLNSKLYQMHLIGEIDSLETSSIEEYLLNLVDSIQKKADIKVLYYSHKEIESI